MTATKILDPELARDRALLALRRVMVGAGMWTAITYITDCHTKRCRKAHVTARQVIGRWVEDYTAGAESAIAKLPDDADEIRVMEAARAAMVQVYPTRFERQCHAKGCHACVTSGPAGDGLVHSRVIAAVLDRARLGAYADPAVLDEDPALMSDIDWIEWDEEYGEEYEALVQ